MPLQYPVLGFKSATFWKQVSSHNHLTRAPALACLILTHIKITVPRELNESIQELEFSFNILGVWSAGRDQ